jgi:hypothetical protein
MSVSLGARKTPMGHIEVEMGVIVGGVTFALKQVILGQAALGTLKSLSMILSWLVAGVMEAEVVVKVLQIRRLSGLELILVKKKIGFKTLLRKPLMSLNQERSWKMTQILTKKMQNIS